MPVWMLQWSRSMTTIMWVLDNRADGFLIKHKYINFLQRMSAEAQTNEKEVNENHDRNIINLKLTINTNNIFNMDGIRTLSHPWPLFGKRFTLWARCDKKKTLPFGFVVKHYLELILHSFALENLLTASWALVDDPIRVNKIKRNFL